MTESIEVHKHLHIHEGVSEEAARAAAEAFALAETEVELPSGEVTELPAEAIDSEARAIYVGRAYSESGGKAKPLLEFLADNPERLIPFPEVSTHLGFETPRSLPGVLGSFGKRANHRYKGVWPFEAPKEHGQWFLRMSQDDADIINALR